MKKFYSLFATALFVFSTYGSAFADHLPAEQPNMLADGDMALATIEPWRQWGQSGPGFLLEKLEGAMHIKSDPGINGGFQQLNIPIEKHGTYFFSMDYRLLSGDLKSTFGNKNSNADFANFADILKQPTGGEYWNYTRFIKIPANYKGDFRVVVTLENGEGYVDNMVLRKVTDFDYFDGSRAFDDHYKIRDPWMDFDGTAHWRNWGTPNVLRKDLDPIPSDEWDTALYLDTLGIRAGAQQLNIPVEKFKQYRLKFSYYLSSGVLQPVLGIRSSNADFEGIVNRLTPAAGWQEYERTFSVPNDFIGDFRLVFVLRNGQGYIDDVTIEEVVGGISNGTLYVQDVDRGDFVALPEREDFLIGQADINLGTFTVSASDVENVLLKDLKFLLRKGEVGEEHGRFGLMRLYRGEELVGTASDVSFFNHEGDLSEDRLIEFSNLRLTIPQGGAVELSVRTDSLPAAEGGVPANGYLVLSPELFNPSVQAFGTTSGVTFGGSHLVYGPSYGGDDRDFDLYGKWYYLGAGE